MDIVQWNRARRAWGLSQLLVSMHYILHRVQLESAIFLRDAMFQENRLKIGFNGGRKGTWIRNILHSI